MPLLESLVEKLRTIAPFLAVVAAVLLGLGAARWLLLRRDPALGEERARLDAKLGRRRRQAAAQARGPAAARAQATG